MAETRNPADPPVLPPWTGRIDRRLATDRRHGVRFAWDRRRSHRRAQKMGVVLFSAAALIAPLQLVRLHPVVGGVSSAASRLAPLPPDQAYDHLIAEAAVLYDLSPALIKAIIRTESSFRPSAVSPVGAQGLMQLMPAVAREMGVLNPLDPRENIMGGAKYLRQLLDATRGSLPLALASYNAGPGNVARYKGIPPFKETRSYVKKITTLLERDKAADAN